MSRYSKRPYKRLSDYILKSEHKTLYKNGKRYECDKVVWTDETLYTVAIFTSIGKCVGAIRTKDMNKANQYYKEH